MFHYNLYIYKLINKTVKILIVSLLVHDAGAFFYEMVGAQI